MPSLRLAGVSLREQAGRGPAVDMTVVSLDGGQRIWSATTEVPQPDLYADAFLVDGSSPEDPGGQLFKRAKANSWHKTS